MRRKEQERIQWLDSLQKRLDEIMKEDAAKIDIEEIAHIISLMEKVNPDFKIPEIEDEEAFAMEALARFKKEYLPRREKEEKKKRIRIHLKKTGIAATIMIAVFTIVGLGTYANGEKGFFNFFKSDGKKINFEYIGQKEEVEEMEMITLEPTYYYSWEELPEDLLDDIMVPTYEIEGVPLKDIYVVRDMVTNISATYQLENDTERMYSLNIDYCDSPYYFCSASFTQGNYKEELKINGIICTIYELEDGYAAHYNIERYVYRIEGRITYEQLLAIIEGMA